MDDGEGSASSATTSGPVTAKDPRTIARKYQLELCKRAVEENIIVYLGTGCGKTHIAVLLMYELGHLIRKPSHEVCVFLAPTIPLVRQQAMVIENLTDFKVRCYHGNGKISKDHHEWDKEIEDSEVLVMTPQILLHNLRHCFIKMNLIALLIFDECHHAQAQKRHPYAQIMKEFYRSNERRPRVFGMTASPIMGKGGSNQLNYTKCINSLEHLLDAKVCTVDNVDLESVVASPDIEIYPYGPVNRSTSSLTITYSKKLDELKLQCESTLRESQCDLKDSQKKLKTLWRFSENLTFCLQNLGLCGAIQAARALLSSDGNDLVEKEVEKEANSSGKDICFVNQYLNRALAILSDKLFDNELNADSFTLETLEEPFFSKKFSVLVEVLSKYRLEPNMKCIIFVKRIVVARTIAYILQNLQCLDFWKCDFLVGCHSVLGNMSRNKMNAIVEKFSSGKVNLLVATSVAEEGLDIQTCCLVVRFDLPETVASFIQSRGRARMTKSKYVFLLERGNQTEEKLINDFVAGESIMNKEIDSRTSDDIFDCLEETIYRVNRTGASISTGCSISLLHRYCGNLPCDIFFTPSPKFFYVDDMGGIICKVFLPPNAAIRLVDGLPRLSKDEAKRDACLKACTKLHELGALTDFLLPDPGPKKLKGSTTHNTENNASEDENLRGELHEMLNPAILKPVGCNLDCVLNLHFYYIRFIPEPADRCYRMFGLFVINTLPKETEDLDISLHLAHSRIVKAGIKHLGMTAFNKEEASSKPSIMLARNFQEMCLKILLDRSEFASSRVLLGKDGALDCNSTFYLLLPIKQKFYGDKFMIDWPTVRRCLSSPAFQHPASFCVQNSCSSEESLKLHNGIFRKDDVVGSLVFTPHNNLFFFIDDVLHQANATDKHKKTTYAEHYKEKFGILLSHPEQPLLKAKQLFNLRNLLHNRVHDTTEGREVLEHFVEIPPELCSLKIIGFSKDIGSSLSLLPSLMHRLENLLVAIELKDVMLSSFPEASVVRASFILEALTTEKCLERFSLERFEVLGDAFLKYAVGRYTFVSCEGLDEGQLTRRRSAIVNNWNLYELAIGKRLQGYIRDQLFEPSQFFALGRPCRIVCNPDTEANLHQKDTESERRESSNLRCTKSHHWLQRKTIADVVEALVGAFLVESGFKAAFAFLRWLGIGVDFEVSGFCNICDSSSVNLSLMDNTDVAKLEERIGHKFKYKGLILQALTHPSFSKHSGGCYQRLEFLGDAVLEYLITSYLYSAYPDLKPGQITDLRSIAVNNNSFAHVAVWQSIHKYLIKDSMHLTKAVDKFENYVLLPNAEKDLLEEPACPKVLGDIVESCVGAVLLDTGFDLNYVWKLMLTFLKPVLSFSSMHINPVRELRELCQSCGFELGLPKPVKVNGDYLVHVEVNIKSEVLMRTATNRNSKAARKVAAQDALSRLKDYGYKHKHKTLEDILRATTKKLPELIGFDEEPLVIETYISTQMEKLQISNQGESVFPFPNKGTSFSTNSKTSTQGAVRNGMVGTSNPCNGSQDQPKVPMQNSGTPYVAIEKTNQKEYYGDMVHKTARSFLFELCVVNYWNPPIFECCREEGPDHLRKFTYKVIIQIKGMTPTILECYSEAKQQKRAAQEHAAQGALWYLQQLGYLPQHRDHI